jgi:hypothetical protein
MLYSLSTIDQILLELLQLLSEGYVHYEVMRFLFIRCSVLLFHIAFKRVVSIFFGTLPFKFLCQFVPSKDMIRVITLTLNAVANSIDVRMSRKLSIKKKDIFVPSFILFLRILYYFYFISSSEHNRN